MCLTTCSVSSWRTLSVLTEWPPQTTCFPSPKDLCICSHHRLTELPSSFSLLNFHQYFRTQFGFPGRTPCLSQIPPSHTMYLFQVLILGIALQFTCNFYFGLFPQLKCSFREDVGSLSFCPSLFPTSLNIGGWHRTDTQ